MKLSIIIPVYNSQDSLEPLYEAIRKDVSVSHEVIFVNDNSTDKSLEVIKGLKGDNIILLDSKVNQGQQKAIYTALPYVSGDCVITMDDDLQHDTKDIMALYHHILMGYDLVYAISVDSYQAYRKLGSRLTGQFFSWRYKLKDKRVSSFRIFTRDLAEKTYQYDYQFVYISAIMLQYTDNIGQIEVKKHTRPFGKSGYNFKKLLTIFLKLHYYYGYLPSWVKMKRTLNEKTHDLRSGQLSIERHPEN